MFESSSNIKLDEQYRQAINWLVRLRSDDMNEDELLAFAEWLSLDRNHSVALANAEQLFDEMTFAAQSISRSKEHQHELNHYKIPSYLKLAQPTPQTEQKHHVKQFGYRWFNPILALAACLFAMIQFFPSPLTIWDHFSSDYYTKKGEFKQVVLEDGSNMLLNTNSAASVEYNQHLRKITLHHGQVRFTVAKDADREFIVFTNYLKIRALGTIFQVYKSELEDIEVTVQEHAVAISHNFAQLAKTGSITIHSGEQLHYKKGQPISQPESVKLNQVTAWQQQKLIINDQPLSHLISELERYHNGHIFISDENLKSLHVTGVFSLDTPETALTSVCKVLNLKVSRVGSWVLLHR
jgi:transmembrane sensor